MTSGLISFVSVLSHHAFKRRQSHGHVEDFATPSVYWGKEEKDLVSGILPIHDITRHYSAFIYTTLKNK